MTNQDTNLGNFYVLFSMSNSYAPMVKHIYLTFKVCQLNFTFINLYWCEQKMLEICWLILKSWLTCTHLILSCQNQFKFLTLKFRSLSERNDTLFGEGNVNTAFEAFTSQHQCNHYCEWFEWYQWWSCSWWKRRTVDFTVDTIVCPSKWHPSQAAMQRMLVHIK